MSNFSDNFTRPDSNTTLGSNWVVQTAGTVYGISSNTAYCVTDSGGHNVATHDSGTTDVDVQYTIATLDTPDHIGIVGRLTDSNNYLLLYLGGGTAKIYKQVAGTFTQIASGSATLATSDVWKFRLNGTSLTGYQNGIAVVGPVTETSNATGTKHGMDIVVPGTFRFGPYSSTDLTSASATITESDLPSNHNGNLTVHLVGTNTAWTSSTTWTASGVSGWSVFSKTFVDATHYTVVLTPPGTASPPNGATGTLTLTEGVTGSTAPTTTVNTPSISITPTSGATSTTPSLTFTGSHTLWSTQSPGPAPTVSGGTGASIGSATVTSDTACSATLTTGSAVATLTITDTSTGATASFSVTAATVLARLEYNTIKQGTTSVSTRAVMRATGTSLEVTGKIFSDFTLAYWRQGGSPTSVTPVTLAAITTAWTSGGVKEASSSLAPGDYRIDWPDAAFATGADWVDLIAQVSGCFAYYERIALAAKTTSDISNTLGTPAGTSVSADVAAIKTDTAAVKTQTDKLTFTGGFVQSDLQDILASPVILDPDPNSGTAQAGGASTITLASAADATHNDIYKGCIVKLTGGTGAVQTRTIVSYVASTRVATVDWPWIVQPDNTTTYEVEATNQLALNSQLAGSASIAAGGITTASFASGATIPRVTLADTLTTYTGNTPQTGDAFNLIGTAGAGLTALAPASTALSTINWTTTRAGKLDFLTGDAFVRIGALGAGLTALAPASTALSNVQWTNARAINLDNLDAAISSRSTYAGGAVASVTGNVGGNLVGTVGSLAAQAKTDVAAAVLDATQSGHTTAGSIGASINTAATAGDPWAVSLPGAYGAGTAGAIVGGNLDAKVSLTALAATALSTVQWTNTRAGLIDHLDANITSRSTYAGGAVASVTAAVTVGTNNDKTGYALSAAGVDAVQVEGVNLRQAMCIIYDASGAGVITLAGTATPTIKDPTGTSTRMVLAGADSAGNRSGSTITPPA